MKLPVCSRCHAKEFEIMIDDGVDGAQTDMEGWVWSLEGNKVRQLVVGEKIMCKECGRQTTVKS